MSIGTDRYTPLMLILILIQAEERMERKPFGLRRPELNAIDENGHGENATPGPEIFRKYIST